MRPLVSKLSNLFKKLLLSDIIGRISTSFRTLQFCARMTQCLKHFVNCSSMKVTDMIVSCNFRTNLENEMKIFCRVMHSFLCIQLQVGRVSKKL